MRLLYTMLAIFSGCGAHAVDDSAVNRLSQESRHSHWTVDLVAGHGPIQRRQK
ncbi:hypothetical protein VP780_11475 [Pseudomonas donghuensis]|nr:hypothetical protein VP780_11475 [Pseudomonas donghuensis]